MIECVIVAVVLLYLVSNQVGSAAPATSTQSVATVAPGPSLPVSSPAILAPAPAPAVVTVVPVASPVPLPQPPVIIASSPVLSKTVPVNPVLRAPSVGSVGPIIVGTGSLPGSTVSSGNETSIPVLKVGSRNPIIDAIANTPSSFVTQPSDRAFAAATAGVHIGPSVEAQSAALLGSYSPGDGFGSGGVGGLWQLDR